MSNNSMLVASFLIVVLRSAQAAVSAPGNIFIVNFENGSEMRTTFLVNPDGSLTCAKAPLQPIRVEGQNTIMWAYIAPPSSESNDAMVCDFFKNYKVMPVTITPLDYNTAPIFAMPAKDQYNGQWTIMKLLEVPQDVFESARKENNDDKQPPTIALADLKRNIIVAQSLFGGYTVRITAKGNTAQDVLDMARMNHLPPPGDNVIVNRIINKDTPYIESGLKRDPNISARVGEMIKRQLDRLIGN